MEKENERGGKGLEERIDERRRRKEKTIVRQKGKKKLNVRRVEERRGKQTGVRGKCKTEGHMKREGEGRREERKGGREREDYKDEEKKERRLNEGKKCDDGE